MQLIGLFDSPYVRRVAITMRLYGFEFEHVALSVFRHMEEMRQINPLLKVPVLVLDNGERLLDSSFILDYLDSEVPEGKRLMPSSGPERRRVQQQCAIALVAAEKTVQFAYETTLRPQEFSYAPWVARCTAQLHRAFRMLETMQPSPALSGAPLTQADITTAVVVRFAQYTLPTEFHPGLYPALEALSAHCEALSAFRDTPVE